MGKALRNIKVRLLESIYANRTIIDVKTPIFSFTFDDAPVSAAEIGGRKLESIGATGTFYISRGMPSGVGPHPLLSSGEIAELRSRGHDIQCHSHSHLDQRRSGLKAVAADCAENRKSLSELLPGHVVEHFAYPYGSVSPWGKRAIRKSYRTLRTIDGDVNRGRVDLAYLHAVELFSKDLDRGRIAHLVESCEDKPGWLVFYTHEISDEPTVWGTKPRDFNWVVDLCRGKGQILNISEAYNAIQ